MCEKLSDSQAVDSINSRSCSSKINPLLDTARLLEMKAEEKVLPLATCQSRQNTVPKAEKAMKKDRSEHRLKETYQQRRDELVWFDSV